MHNNNVLSLWQYLIRFLRMRVDLLLVLFFVTTYGLMAQDTIAYSFNGQNVGVRQLKKDYENYKNQVDSNISIQDFCNAELKKKIFIQEALEKRIDTSYAFKVDMESTKEQLLPMYLPQFNIDNSEYIANQRERFITELEINHFFVPFDSLTIFPKDTLEYYNRALVQRNLALENGFSQFTKNNDSESFGVVYDLDRYNGYMGWISPFLYPENVDDLLFSTSVGEITMPIRTDKGYHVFEVLGKRKSQGNPVVEMVIFNFPKIPAPVEMIDSVRIIAQNTYNEILVKNNFPQICSEFLRATGAEGSDCTFGEINIRSKIPYPLINTAFQLKKEGEVSAPVLTDYGFVLMRLKEKMKPLSEEDIDARIAQIISSDYYKAMSFKKERKKYIDSVGIKINQPLFDSILSVANVFYPTDSLFVENLPQGDEYLIKFNDSIEYDASSFRQYFKFIKDFYIPVDLGSGDIFTAVASSIISYSLSSEIIEDALDRFILAAIQEEMRNRVESDNEEYKKLVSLFRDDFLYANLLKQEVWDKSNTQTKDLEAIFEQNKNKYTLDQPRWKGFILFSNDKSLVDQLKKKSPKNRMTLENQIRKKGNVDFSILEGSWEKGQNQYVDYVIFENDIQPQQRDKYKHYVLFGEIIEQPVDFLDVFDQVQRDYQDQVEQTIVKDGYVKYNIVKNNEVINTIE